jgi:hypothetical protein
MRSWIRFATLLWIKTLSRAFYRHDVEWVGDVPPDPWRDIRLVVFLHHTSLYEPLFTGITPNHFLWRVARHGVIPAADKTMRRPIVGRIFRLVARHVMPITRKRDQTWYQVLQKIDPNSMVVVLPEGRMMRKTGLDSNNNRMSVRGGVADVIDMVAEGRMLIAYSGGLHHVQAPGEINPRLFETLRMRLEVVDLAKYRKRLGNGGDFETFRKAVREDLQLRKDCYCPLPPEHDKLPASLSGTQVPPPSPSDFASPPPM